MDRTRKVQVVVYTMNPEPEFLTLKTIPKEESFWQNVTGAIEDGETPQDAAYRELKEETCIGRDMILEFRQLFSFRYMDRRNMEVEETVFSARVNKGTTVDITKNVYPEHETFRWCPAEEAEKLMKWETNSRAVRAVMENLKK
jgi:8-oxo-dGTP pyrophosphatase MutT (NUDIX family)